MALSEKDIKNMARNFFEKCLIDAEWERHNVAVLMRGTSEWSVPDEMQRLREKSYRAYEDLKRRNAIGDYEERHEITAFEILQYHSVPENEGVALMDAFCLAILRAETEAERIKLAVYSGDTHKSGIKDPYFAGCRNAFADPPYEDIDLEVFADTPYFEAGSASLKTKRPGRPKGKGKVQDQESLDHMRLLLSSNPPEAKSVNDAARQAIEEIGFKGDGEFDSEKRRLLDRYKRLSRQNPSKWPDP